MGALGALVTCILCAGIWAGVTIATGYQIGWMAIGVGFAVGIAVRTLGEGDSIAFGILGAGFALLSCVLGNLFSAIGIWAKESGVSFFQAATHFDYALSIDVLTATASPMDFLFYGLALYEGFKISVISE